MIAFACAHCGMKLTVKPEFAGRSSRCPTCRQPLVVPAPDVTQGSVAAGQIDGTESSFAQAGLGGGVTLDHPSATTPGSQKSVQELLARRSKKGERYIIEAEIARGGMGAVLRAVDCDIRREVAVKYMLDHTDARKKRRFIEEAQITGQLEHPNIVPIHELVLDAQKRLFFAMKMVKGRSLKAALDELRKYPKTAVKEYSLGRLLSVFVNVCHALGYAHARGVVHRDLKPANIMIGDFGETYVMDWGLAKVVTATGQAATAAPAPVAAVAPNQKAVAAMSGKLLTNREEEADLTQEGSILGTPAYMSPEQAEGRVTEVDPRSDVYSLGALLYEMLALQPPVNKEGGYLAVLMRVVQGEIVPPEQRNPQRARSGNIPKELSAIAMKALAKEPRDRYPTVEALRRDIERFQEGRSVSAKEDTFREMVWKLVKRNKGASVTAAIAALIMVGILWLSFRAIYRAKVGAETALAALENEQRTKRERGQKSAPFFFRDAKVSADKRQIDYALAQVNVALEYDPELLEARLLKGQLLIVSRDFAGAQRELEPYVRKRPDDKDAAQLAELCKKARPEERSSTVPFIQVLRNQKLFSLADQLTEDRAELLRSYHARVEAAYKGRGNWLRMDGEGKLHLSLNGFPELRNLDALRGMPLDTLDLGLCNVLEDLEPLREMPLTALHLVGCNSLTNLTPLKDLRLLRTLGLSGCARVHDLSPLQDLPLTDLGLADCGSLRDLTPLKKLKLRTIALTPKYITKGLEALRDMETLETIQVALNSQGQGKFSRKEFWAKYKAGDFEK